ncbi:hypothetical protein [Pedobacter africanus]|uniref:Outer membrane protein beta-barrel domain-containing protein n=1 Tax=Pedobacter africanus TaxID=151894 RepID=A0A1W2DLU4_9SPHI|nr:hypothetical protein [Pedobacter africanus]SMC98393.1 hypothetical protein SAMN04488524_3979 [Pedobacter africanus]
MKKLIFTIILGSTLAFAANAQIQKGNVMIGANLSNIKFGLDKPNAFTFNISPKAAWFVQDGLAFGGEVNLGLATQKGSGTDISYGISALGRYYGETGANEVVKSSRFFGEATVGVQGYNPSAGGSTNGLGFSFGPGFTYFVTPSIGLEALLKYNGVVGFGSSAYAHNLGLGVGFQIYLPGKSTARKVQKDMN